VSVNYDRYQIIKSTPGPEVAQDLEFSSLDELGMDGGDGDEVGDADVDEVQDTEGEPVDRDLTRVI
jgi:hypothetical protein